ncbi:TPA: exotoxin beta-grasp domain-containing protein [Staphylococcus aureus]
MKMTTIAKASLALSLITTGAITMTTQAANAKQDHKANPAKAPNSIEGKTSTAKAEKAPQPEQETRKSPTSPTMPQTKVTTPSSSNMPQSTQPTKAENPQSLTTTQAPTEINSKYKDLRAYYTKPSLEFKKQFGFMLTPWTTVRFMNIIPELYIYKIALVGKDDQKYKDGPHENIDVFMVLEENKYKLKEYSVGGITKTNSKEVNHKVDLNITKDGGKGEMSKVVSNYMIHKEEISLKELDFKLRKQLIEKHNLYGNIGSGTIVIKMKNGGKYTFELHKKLQEHRMADVIDGTNIDKIEVNIKAS